MRRRRGVLQAPIQSHGGRPSLGLLSSQRPLRRTDPPAATTRRGMRTEPSRREARPTPDAIPLRPGSPRSACRFPTRQAVPPAPTTGQTSAPRVAATGLSGHRAGQDDRDPDPSRNLCHREVLKHRRRRTRHCCHHEKEGANPEEFPHPDATSETADAKGAGTRDKTGNGTKLPAVPVSTPKSSSVFRGSRPGWLQPLASLGVRRRTAAPLKRLRAHRQRPVCPPLVAAWWLGCSIGGEALPCKVCATSKLGSFSPRSGCRWHPHVWKSLPSRRLQRSGRERTDAARLRDEHPSSKPDITG